MQGWTLLQWKLCIVYGLQKRPHCNIMVVAEAEIVFQMTLLFPRYVHCTYVLLLFSLDRSLTKNKILNTKCQLIFLFFAFVWIQRALCIFTFQIETPKNFRWQLVFSIWFLVTSRSNENIIYCYIYIFSHSMVITKRKKIGKHNMSMIFFQYIM